jgi:hypothetical protein
MFLVLLWLASLASAILSSCEASVPSHCTHLGQQSSYGWTFGLTEPNRSFLHVLTDISYLKLGTHWFPKVSRLSSYMHSMLLTLACIWCECTLLLRSFCDASRQCKCRFFFSGEILIKLCSSVTLLAGIMSLTLWVFAKITQSSCGLWSYCFCTPFDLKLGNVSCICQVLAIARMAGRS